MNLLLNTLLTEMKLKNDAALAHALEVAPPVISKYRHDRLKIGPTMILNIHERFGLPVKRIRELAAA